MTSLKIAPFVAAPRPSRSRRAALVNAARDRKRLVSAYDPDGMAAQPRPEPQVTLFRINGKGIGVMLWSAVQWEQLDPKPEDARPNPDGSWVELRWV